MSENIKNKEPKRPLVSFDWAIKSILRKKENFDILNGFLTALLKEDIEILDVIESESNAENDIDKFNRVDLRARDSQNREIIVELQYDAEYDYLQRIYYGTSKTVVEYLKAGDKYRKIKKVISVSIVYFDLTKEAYLVKGKMKFEDMNNPKKELSNIEDIFAEYYFIQPNWFNDNIIDDIDEWVYMFKHSEVKEGSRAKNIDKAEKALEYAHMTPQEQRDYDYYNYVSKRSAMNVLKAREDKGRREGRKEGRKEGKKEGIKEGRKDGIKEGEKTKALEIAAGLLDILDNETIAAKTGLSVEEVRALRNKNLNL